MEREPGFYWLSDPQRKNRRSSPNPFVAYWSGDDWEFHGTDFTFRDNEKDDDGEVFMARFTIIGKVAPAQLPTQDELFDLMADYVDCEGGGLRTAAGKILERLAQPQT